MPNEEEWRVRVEMLERKVELLHRRLVVVEARPITGLDCGPDYDGPRVYDDSWSWPPDDATVTELREQILDERARAWKRLAEM